MADHKSALKRIRQDEVRKERNRYYARTMRNAIRKFRSLTSKAEAEEKLPKLIALIDRNIKRSIIHKNTASNLKSKLTKFTASLS
jgi:small subunit ribosomal protein S20